MGERVTFDTTVVLLDGPEEGEHQLPEHLAGGTFEVGKVEVRIDDPDDERFALCYDHVEGNTFRFKDRTLRRGASF